MSPTRDESAEIPPAQTEALLRALSPESGDGFLELRLIPKSGPIRQSYHRSAGELVNAAGQHIAPEEKMGVYFGACVRAERNGTKAAVKGVSCLWADLDAKDFAGGKAEALNTLRQFPIAPTAIVDSGHGYHPYWRLKEPEMISSPDDITRVEAYHKGLAVALGGDTASAELARVLRLPGSVNWKDESDPKAVTIVELNPMLEYNLCDFDEYLAAASEAPSQSTNSPGWIADALRDLRPGNRNQSFTRIAGKLHRERWTLEDILELLAPHADRTGFPKDELRGLVRGVTSRYSHERAGEIADDTSPTTRSELPVICVNARQFRDVLDDAWRAVLRANNPEPSLFVRENALVRIADSGDVSYIEHLKEPVVFEHISRAANWIRIKGKYEIEVPPPKDVSRVMHANPHAELPQLEGLRTTPFFSSAGSLIDSDGYHETEKIWLRSDGLAGLPSIITIPSQSEIRSACALLCDDLLGEFPFVADSDIAHALAAFIQPFVRRLIYGPTPLHVIEAPIAGSGKGLMCELISLCAVGTPIEARTMPEKDSETRKMITAELSRGRPIILFDNIRDRMLLDSPPLASVLTILTWTDRWMGESRMISLPNRALWLLTGNNVRLSTELARRSLRIRIDPRMDQPWRRTFRHANLRDWATSNRPRLVAAVLQIVQAWIAEGMPLSGNHLGSYENWSGVLGGVLEVARVPGFLGNLGSFYKDTDAQGQPWREFTETWWGTFGTDTKRISELNTFCNMQDLLVGVRGDKTDRSQETRLGFALQNARDRIYGRFRIDQVNDDAHKGRTYRLAQVEASESGAGTLDQTSPSTSPESDQLCDNELHE